MANLTVTTTEDLTLDGAVYTSSHSVIYNGVLNVYKQTLSVPVGDPAGVPPPTFTSLLTMGTTIGGGTIIRANFKYARIKNTSATDEVVLRVQKAGGSTVFLTLPARESLVLSSYVVDANSSGATFAGWDQIDTISAISPTTPCKVEVFVATA